MAIVDSPIGSSAILRLSGCPICLWLRAANPHLFSLVRQLDKLQEEYTLLGKRLVESIGTELVPYGLLSLKDRAIAIGIRRQLYNGQSISKSSYQQLAELAQILPQAIQLVEDIDTIAQLSEEITTLEARLSKMAFQEPARLSRVAWELINTSSVTGTLLHNRDPAFYLAMEGHVQRGDQWAGKSLRRRGEHLWKIIDRATTKSIPRDWHGHVALLLFNPDISALSSIVITQEVATVWCQNIHSQRQVLSNSPLKDADPKIRLAVTPLHWERDDHFLFWVTDPNNPVELVEVEMRRTSLLDTIYTTLSPGVKALEEFETAILPKPDEEELDLLHKFTDHLIGLGVIQVSSTPQEYLESWHLLTSITTEQRHNDSLHNQANYSTNIVASSKSKLSVPSNLKKDGFLDVYRQTSTPMPLSRCMRLQKIFEQVQRILAIIEADRLSVASSAWIAAEEQPQPLLGLLRERMLSPTIARGQRKRFPHWPPSIAQDSSYSRLLQFISSKAEESTVIDISNSLLDDLGAPDGAINWPIDCILRVPCPGAEFEAVLEEAFPAGSLDARFVNALRIFHGNVIPHADNYQQFLELLEQESGIKFLELLIPPLSVGAANAVKRPIYTRFWTGDADINTYCTHYHSIPSYIPLSAISLRRRADGHLVVEADGHPVCPMYHATRIPLAPWSILAETLLAAAPLPMGWSPRRLQHSLDAFPERNFMPRITVDDQLVLACAQWRLSSDAIWDPGSSSLAKIRALEKLRQQWNLPRWVFVSTGTGTKPMACDLESIRAIHIIERTIKTGDTDILVVEMLPTPNQLLVHEQADGSDEPSASAIMLRLPCDESPIAMAIRLAKMFARNWTEE